MNRIAWARIMLEVRPGIMLGLLTTELRRRMYAHDVFYRLSFDLTETFSVPELGQPLKVREIQEADIPRLLPVRRRFMDIGELRLRLERLILLKAGIPAGDVCIGPDRQPCALCWLISSRSNSLLQRHFRGGLIELGVDEVLQENTDTHPYRRGGRIMAFLTLKLSEVASRQGTTRAIDFYQGRKPGFAAGRRADRMEALQYQKSNLADFSQAVNVFV